MFASIPSLVTALFIGAWTDMVGRRPALALPAIGSSIEAVIVLLTMYLKWPIYVLFVGSAINGLCGFFTTVAMATMAYIADTTNESDRSFRLGRCIIDLNLHKYNTVMNTHLVKAKGKGKVSCEGHNQPMDL